MKSYARIASVPASIALAADDILEFHAGRLLLLIRMCGTASRIDGLTKMAKLDFFVRYPDFFDIAARKSSGDAPQQSHAVESAMVRHHYGPWDKRYYHVLSALEARGLISISKKGKAFAISLTPAGQDVVGRLASLPSFAPLVARMKTVKEAFGAKSGNSLKQLIYRVFDEEVGKRKLGEVITP